MVKNRLKEIRMKEYMCSQTEFAKILEMDYRQYNRYEKETEPKLETAIQIALKLNKKVEDIFYLE